MPANTVPTVEILSESEARAAVPALCDVLIDCVEDGASVGFMAQLTPAQAHAFWTGVADAVGDNATVLIVARVGGEIVGTVQLGVKLPPNQPHRADLKKLLVHRKARGLGLARALMDEAEAQALQHGRRLLVLDTATGSAAEAIYERLGWQSAGVIPDYALYPDGRFCASTFFYKLL